MKVDRRCVAALGLLFLGGTVGACRQDSPAVERPTGLDDETYVQVMAELMLLNSGPPEGAAGAEWEASLDSLREEILAAHGVSAPEILEFAEIVGSEAGRMEALWQAIAQKHDSMRVARLQPDTEARSEPEGKLGRGAPSGAPAESAATAPGRKSPRRKPLAWPPGSRPATRDTATGSR